MVQRGWTAHERVYRLWAEHRQLHREQEGRSVEHDCGRFVSRCRGFHVFGKLMQALCSEYQTGFDHIIRRLHV